MSFPSEKELSKARKKLAKAIPSRTLTEDASKADRLKYRLCEKFVIYLMKHKITQAQLARRLRIDPSRVNEIVKYRIDLFTVDKLMDLAEQLELKFKILVA